MKREFVKNENSAKLDKLFTFNHKKMSLSQMQQDNALYISALRKETERIIEAVRSKCNADKNQDYLEHIQNYFNRAITNIKDTRENFEKRCKETKKTYNSGDIIDLEFLQEEMKSNKMSATVDLSSIFENTLKGLGKQSGIDISEMLQIIDKLKQETLDFIESAK